MTSPFSLGLLAAGAVMLFVAGIATRRRERSVVSILVNESTSALTPSSRFLASVPVPASLVARAQFTTFARRLDAKLRLAGSANTVGTVITTMAAAGVIGAVIGAVVGLLAGVPFVLPALFGAAVGGVIPLASVHEHADRIRKAVTAGLPSLFDLLVLADSAGKTELDGVRMAAEQIGGPLGMKLQEVLAGSARLGASPVMLFQELANQTGNPVLEDFATTLALSTTYGGSDYASALRAQAQRLREDQQAAIERKVATMSTLLILPVGVFLLPSILLIMTGPEIGPLLHALKGF